MLNPFKNMPGALGWLLNVVLMILLGIIVLWVFTWMQFYAAKYVTFLPWPH